MTSLSLCPVCIMQTLMLLLAANGAPVLAGNLLKTRCAWPLDSGLRLADDRPLLGQTKTWRGLVSGVGMTAGVAALLAIDVWTGFMFGILAMGGDLLSSFIKRRLGKKSSSRARGLDTVPESLLPAWILREHLSLSVIDIAVIIGLFFLFEENLSPLLYKWHIRKRPY
ncbi:MAG: CDP-archaeol synthase [Gammaproteobacteria bacterium HGW-Gammaproteobacteria-3]|nr:MAG: CDP-archaeol synthase [Gammaproteobacteria bacterium HGW-Gammaproteobacteria-3]